MEKITYKYNVGDRLQFKKKFHATASCGLKALAGCTAKVTERRDYNGPCYRLEGLDGFFTEKCFAGLKEDK
jgi:hypothetical protein